MAIYRGVNGVNRKIKEEWRGVNGVNRKIKEEWRGVNGVNRKVFSSWDGVLYDRGDEKRLLTSGFRLIKKNGKKPLQNHRLQNSMLFGDDGCNDGSSHLFYIRAYSAVISRKPINLSGLKKINIFYSEDPDKNLIRSFKPLAIQNTNEYATSESTSDNDVIGTLDISNLNGFYYIGFEGVNWGPSGFIHIDKIWLE